jgi:hypothetical protein
MKRFTDTLCSKGEQQGIEREKENKHSGVHVLKHSDIRIYEERDVEIHEAEH